MAKLDDVPAAFREWEQSQTRRIVEPCIVAWDGKFESVAVRLPKGLIDRRLRAVITEENGAVAEWQFRPSEYASDKRSGTNDSYASVPLPFHKLLTPGYHRLTLDAGRRCAETLVISAPTRAYSREKERGWGIFIPLYSLHSARSWGAGDFSDMETLARWTGDAGGSAVATLPLLPAFLDRTYEPSPYLPVSKLAWNEFYIDIAKMPELAECESARNLMNSGSFRREIESLRRSRLVEYRRLMALKRTLLEELNRHFFSSDSPRRGSFQLFLREHPEVTEYARFRAVMEKQKKPWREWPPPLRNGKIDQGKFDESAEQYHLYVQWLADGQVKRLAECASGSGAGLYLDLPLGTHPDGFDTWRYRDIFVDGVSVGAPPDTVFTRGQNWTFPPLHPQKVREAGYAYVIGYLRHHMRYARTLRLDHIMGLHRLFFIPHGMESSEGVYVRYHPEEMYAILSLESHRYQCAIVGEDLGIVPRAVRSAMRSHGLQRMWVMHYELATNSRRLLPKPMPDQIASLNTHDMPPFASFWEGQDIEDRLHAGIISPSVALREEASHVSLRRRLVTFLVEKRMPARPITARSVLEACLSFLGSSRASLVLVNLEDLWLETHAQNIPSTTTEHPNWRRKARYGFESFCQMPRVMSILEVLHALRPGGGSNGGSGGKTRKNQ